MNGPTPPPPIMIDDDNPRQQQAPNGGEEDVCSPFANMHSVLLEQRSGSAVYDTIHINGKRMDKWWTLFSTMKHLDMCGYKIQSAVPTIAMSTITKLRHKETLTCVFIRK